MLRVWTHGWTGYRSRLQGLYFDPSLPPQLSNYTVKGLSWGGSRFNVNLNTNKTTITHVSGSKAVNVEISKQNPGKAGNHTLAVGESLVVPTRSTDGTLIEGNYAQCAQVISEDVSFANRESLTVPGQFALAAIDGSNATTWQPATNASSTLAVDLIDAKNLSAFHINWGNSESAACNLSALASERSPSRLLVRLLRQH